MQAKYIVRRLKKNDFASAAGLGFAVFEIMSDSAQTVAVFYEEAQAYRVCKALQKFSETGTKPLGSSSMYITPAADSKPQSVI